MGRCSIRLYNTRILYLWLKNVLVAESKVAVNEKLEQWSIALETQGLRIPRSKTYYLWCNFNGKSWLRGVETNIWGQRVPQKDSFKYLGSMIQKGCDVTDDNTTLQKDVIKFNLFLSM